MTHGGSSKSAGYGVQSEQLCKAVGNVISAETDMLKCGSQNRKDCDDLFFSTSHKLTEDEHRLSTGEDVRSSVGYLHQDTVKFKEKQNKTDFLCQTACSSFSMDGSYTKYESSVTKNHRSLWMYDNNCPSGRDCFLDGKFAAAAIFNDYVSFDAPSSSKGNKFLEVDDDVFSELSEGAFHYECPKLCNGVVEINGDFQKPFLKTCSIQGSIMHEKALFANDEHKFQIDSFSADQDLGEYCGNIEKSGAHPCPEVVEIINTSRDSAFLSRASVKECFPSDSCYSATQMVHSGTDHEVLTTEWYPIYKAPFSEATAWDVDRMTDAGLDDLRGISRYYERDSYKEILDDEENRGNFSCNISYCFNSDQCTRSFGNTELYFGGPSDFNKTNFSKWSNSRLVDWPDCDDIYSNKWSDILTEESDWLCPESCSENDKKLGKNRVRRDHVRHPALEKNHGRSRRSFSAPPFYRNKRRFNSLNQPSTIIAKRSAGQTSNCALKNREAGESECHQQSFGTIHPSPEEHLLFENNSNMKQRTDTVEDRQQVNNSTESNRFQSFNSQSSDPFKELISRKVEDSMDYRTKWRNCSPQIPKRDKSLYFQSQDNILDISSGFLHLAGDSLVPETISKKCLKDAIVLRQVDKKFIPIVAGRNLAVIDQHAADERIRLEELRQKVLSGEAKTINYLDAEQELVLPEIGYQLLYSYSEQIKDWGWICNSHAQNSKSFKQNLDILNRQPVVATLIAVPCILGVNLNDVDLMEFLQQLADTDGSSTMPPSVIRVLNLKACRGAIMFGDSLLPSECSLIVEELKHTSLCFQCAHGRPTTVPLVNLEALHNQIAKLGLMNDCSNDNWHGLQLQRHKISVERAAQRLYSSRE